MKTACAPFAAIASLAILLAGCETESAGTSGVSLSPGYARIVAGQSISLKASGGDGYAWSLSNGGCGTLSATTGSQVTYTATRNNVTQIVTLKATRGSSTAQCQATIAQGDAAYASTVSVSTQSSSTVTPSTPSNPSSPSAALAITPSSAELKRGGTVELSANGDNCTWSLSNRSYGTLDTTSGQTVTYTATSENVTQTVTVTATIDGASRSATARIRQVTYSAGDTIHLGGN